MARSVHTISDREREVLECAAQGHSAAETGKRLKISRRTVEVHIINVRAKLKARSITHAVAIAIKTLGLKA